MVNCHRAIIEKCHFTLTLTNAINTTIQEKQDNNSCMRYLFDNSTWSKNVLMVNK